MTDKEDYIPSDEDRKLARKIGEILDGGSSLSRISHPPVQELVRLKHRISPQITEEKIMTSKSKSWNAIDAAINHAPPGPKRFTERPSFFSFIRPAFKYRSLAALFLLVSLVFITLYITVSGPDDSVPIAQALEKNVSLILEDGSSVLLRPNSELYAVSYNSEKDHYKLEGEAYFDVPEEKSRQFVVETSSGFIEVTGTAFNIRTWDNSTQVYLEEGEILLISKNQSDRIRLHPGQYSGIRPDFSILPPVDSDGTSMTAWKRDELIFENRTVASIFNELEHHYRIRLEAPDSVKNDVLGGSISLSDKDTVLEHLGIVLNGEFSPVEKNRYQFVRFE